MAWSAFSSQSSRDPLESPAGSSLGSISGCLSGLLLSGGAGCPDCQAVEHLGVLRPERPAPEPSSVSGVECLAALGATLLRVVPVGLAVGVLGGEVVHVCTLSAPGDPVKQFPKLFSDCPVGGAGGVEKVSAIVAAYPAPVVKGNALSVAVGHETVHVA